MIGYLLASLLGVSNMICWGLYGDLQAEKFELRKVFRSLLLGVIYAFFLYYVNPDAPLLIVALSTISLERITTEIYKALIREESQEKYLIPSDLNFKFPRPLKVIMGFALITLILVSIKFIDLEINKFIVIAIAATLAALGGMAKDAPYEGFDLLKFFRTPVVSLVVGLFLIKFYPETALNFFVLALMGGERIISECYKKIINGKVPGKFKKILYPEWKKKRKYVLIPYTATIVLFIVLFLLDQGIF